MAVLHDSFLIGLVICCDRFVIMTGLFYINHLRIIITSSIVYSDVKASEHLFIIIHHRWSTLVSKLHSIYSSSSLQRSTKTGTVQFFETLRPPVLILLQRRLPYLSSQVDSSIGTAQHQNLSQTLSAATVTLLLILLQHLPKKGLSYVLIFFFLHRVDYCSSMISVFQCINNSHPV